MHNSAFRFLALFTILRKKRDFFGFHLTVPAEGCYTIGVIHLPVIETFVVFGADGMDERTDRLDRGGYEYRLMIKAVWYYYIENYTQQNISHLLGVSRSKVISLLERARQTGVIRFNVQLDSEKRVETERELLRRFGLRDVFIVPGAGTLPNPNESIAQAAAMYILRRAADNAFINMGYGDTTSRILNHLATAAQLPLNVVSLTGGVNCYLPNTNSNVFNARLYLIPSPLLLEAPDP